MGFYLYTRVCTFSFVVDIDGRPGRFFFIYFPMNSLTYATCCQPLESFGDLFDLTDTRDNIIY